MKSIILWLIFLPFQLLLLATFLLIDLIRIPFVLFQSEDEEKNQRKLRKSPCSIVMLNWNGKELLKESVPAVLQAIENTSVDHQFLLVDNGSTDESIDWLNQTYPQVEVLQLDRNYGFSEGNNKGVAHARNDLIVLLNNDMIVSDDFLPPLLEPFERERDIFAVAAQIEFPEGKTREETGLTRGQFSRGYLHLSHEKPQNWHAVRRYAPVLWAGGGASAFDRRKFLELGGFSELFSPCYFEDTDLSYRAWRRGWRILFASESRVMHKHRSSSSRRFTEAQLSTMFETRKLWYLWKNFQLRTLTAHFILFPVNLGRWLTCGQYLRGFSRLGGLLRERFREPRRRYSDKEIFNWIDEPVHYLHHFHPKRAKESAPSDCLRILVVSAYLPHLGTHGGAGRVFQLLKRVAAKHRVTLVSFIEDESDRRFVHQLESFCHRIELVLRREFKPVSFYPYEPFEEFNTEAFRSTLQKVILEEDFDLVHFEWPQMALYADLFPAIPKLMTEIEVNYAAHLSLVRIESSFLRKARKYYNALQTLYRELEMCRAVDSVICVTDNDQAYLEDYIPSEKLTVINTGVDPHYFEFTEEEVEEHSIVFVGAFRHSPNVDAMKFFCNTIFPIIQKAHPNCRLYIVGSGPTPEIKRLGQRPGIFVTGFVEDIRDYYQRAQVVVVPLRTGVGIRGKVLEGWSMGKAMVATSLACQGIHAIHGENIIIADSPELFARWTIALLDNPDFCEHLGRNGRSVVERHYDWEVMAKHLLALYETHCPPSIATSAERTDATQVLSRTARLG